MKVTVQQTNIKAVLYNRYCKANPVSEGNKKISFADFSRNHLTRFAEMEPLLPERWLVFQYAREVFGIKVYERGGQSFEDGYVSFWSNASGDLFDANKPVGDPTAIETITKDELPEPLRYAYENLWSEGYSGLCYLVHTPETGYGVALSYEVAYDEPPIEESEVDALFDNLVNIAVALKVRFGGELMVAERTSDGYDEYHQLMIVLPAHPFVTATDMEDINRAADGMLWGGLCP